MTGTTRAAFKACSILLQYPTDETFVALDDIGAVATALPARRGGRALCEIVTWLRDTSRADAAARYVETFDFNRRASLYLTYYAHGDTRDRGSALLALRASYREAGFEMCSDELPDYLPVMLELAALSDTGVRALDEHRAALEALQTTLSECGSPYADAVDVVRAQLPHATRRVLDAARRMVREGPPTEHVGLEPFAPPEIVTGCGNGCGECP
jgi:nitrate reductase delta subunit